VNNSGALEVECSITITIVMPLDRPINRPKRMRLACYVAFIIKINFITDIQSSF